MYPYLQRLDYNNGDEGLKNKIYMYYKKCVLGGYIVHLCSGLQCDKFTRPMFVFLHTTRVCQNENINREIIKYIPTRYIVSSAA